MKPEQLRVQLLWQQCGVKVQKLVKIQVLYITVIISMLLFHAIEISILLFLQVDARTFQQLWRLCDLGIPPNVVLALMNDIAKYSIKPV